MKKHVDGTGARLTQVAAERGIAFVIAQTWKGDRNFERALKNRKNAPRMCPVCKKLHDATELAKLAALDELL